MMENYLWIFYGILSAFTAALVAIFAKIGINDLDPTIAATLRSFVMALFLVLFIIGTGKLQFVKHVDAHTWFYILLSSFSGALSWWAYFSALHYGSASKVAALDRTSIVFIVLLASLFLGETLSFKVIFGAVLMSLGAICIVW